MAQYTGSRISVSWWRDVSFLITLFFFYGSFAQSLSISGKVDGLADGDVLLGYYYGDKQYVKDTVLVFNIEHPDNNIISTIKRNSNILCGVFKFKNEEQSNQEFEKITTIKLIDKPIYTKD